MANIDNANNAPAATLTKNELFAEFAQSEVTTYDRFGNKDYYTHRVANLLELTGDYVEIHFNIDLADDPESDLEMIENDLLGMLYNVQIARAAFDDLKSKRLITPEEPDINNVDAETYAAWEQAAEEAEENPRFRPAFVASETKDAA
ncbi:hypothetical protein [Phyllobacterium sp. SB3]|uniref:hypothetical protein n=1 Tax=Phyllobacterium sp. SB3 TaxID=3156073 RepID=UPI0032AF7CE3